MKHCLIYLLTFFLCLFISCDDNPASNSPEKVSLQGSLKYEIVEYDNFPQPDKPVEVTYSNLEGETITDIVQIPWEKSFNYDFTTSLDSLADVKAYITVRYEDTEDLAIKARIFADNKVSDGEGIGNSFSIKVEHNFQFIK
jgi:hypothetical protein